MINWIRWDVVAQVRVCSAFDNARCRALADCVGMCGMFSTEALSQISLNESVKNVCTTLLVFMTHVGVNDTQGPNLNAR